MKPFVFYIDPAWRQNAPHIPLLYPFWGNMLDPVKTPFHYALFQKHGFDTRFYTITDEVHKADMVLLPYVHEITLKYFPDLLKKCASVAKKAGKLLLIDGTGDIEYPVKLSHAIVLRYGGYRFTRKNNEIHIPVYAEDLLEAYCGGALQLKEKNKKPTIGFAGWGRLSGMQAARAYVRELPDRLHGLVDSRFKARIKGVFFRHQALEALEHSSLVTTNFLIRSSYSGHSSTVIGDMDALRREHVNTILDSDYTLDVRGDANASTRLFEVLSLGRIPVIVDTERNFPFSDELEYSSFSLIVDFLDLNRLPEIISNFHRSLSPEKFNAMQKAAREAYVSYLRVDAITPHLVLRLRRMLRR